MKPGIITLLTGLLLMFCTFESKGENFDDFRMVAPEGSSNSELRIRSNILPWLITIPNLGIEYAIEEKWSVSLDVLYCPWKLSDKFSVKTLAILPEGRWWLKTNKKGSFFSLHLNVAWFNVRTSHYRYQDSDRPLLGGGIGYGYRIEIKKNWAIEFEIGAGMANAKYDRFYNVENGAMKDTRISTYWGLDRAAITFSYNLCDI